MDDLVLNVEKKIFCPIKEFIDFVFGKNIVLEKYTIFILWNFFQKYY